ncbi:hypothetical protein AGLY_009039 [Aphis glycines]|uniref:Uncharacterized protein n=1 Tax=Aphis glycines TaxID=307491 RepID=A0A6G0TJ94_APHGL|nr:hypothetical protein AGLY_009039 [Aphis glycines]
MYPFFFNKRNINKPKIYLNTICLPFAENITYLGLTFNSNHLEWGAEYCILLTLYRSLITAQPAMAILFIILDPVHNTDIRCATGAFRNWRQVTENRLREINHSVEPWPKFNHSNRKEKVIMNLLRIGHTRIITHGYSMEKTEPASCHSCNFFITVKHIIFHCQMFTDARK